MSSDQRRNIVAVLGRDAEHVADDRHRKRRGDVADEVAFAALADRVDDRVAQLPGSSDSLPRTRCGVKPRFTSLRRLQ